MTRTNVCTRVAAQTDSRLFNFGLQFLQNRLKPSPPRTHKKTGQVPINIQALSPTPGGRISDLDPVRSSRPPSQPLGA